MNTTTAVVETAIHILVPVVRDCTASVGIDAYATQVS